MTFCIIVVTPRMQMEYDLSLSFQGANVSQLERDIGADQFPPNEHYFGLVNVSGVTLL